MAASTVLPSRSDRPIVMGVLNVTPDSFSDGGRYLDTAAATVHGVVMTEQGADIIDVGGESTRPGAQRVEAGVEAARVVPVITELASAGVTVSIDTTRAAVADAALEAGAAIVNDVSGGLADPAMAHVVANAGCPWILMHWRGHSARMADLARYDDVVRDVREELLARVEDATRAGVDIGQLVIDPGLGFAKTAEHNWRLLADLTAFTGTGLPVLLGASRKSFLGSALAGADGVARPPAGRDVATATLTFYAALNGLWGVRVHEIAANVDAAVIGHNLRHGAGSVLV